MVGYPRRVSTRREFLEKLAGATGAIVLLPAVTSCKKEEPASTAEPTPAAEAPSEPAAEPAPEPAKEPAAAVSEPPVAKPADWDPIAYNKTRGNAGAIPETYHASINGPDGDAKHLGKHLPFQPKVEGGTVPDGYLAIMWGDPDKGHARHPNAVPGPDNNNEGHWYNWIKIRKAEEGEAEELQSAYSSWPAAGEGDNGKYVAMGGGDVAADGGKNTIYLAALPKDLKAGDTIRIWAHCLTHGEYVDFLTIA